MTTTTDPRTEQTRLIASQDSFQHLVSTLLAREFAGPERAERLENLPEGYLRALGRGFSVLAGAVLAHRAPCMSGQTYWFLGDGQTLSYVPPPKAHPALVTSARLVTYACAHVASRDPFHDSMWHDLWQTVREEDQRATVCLLVDLAHAEGLVPA